MTNMTEDEIKALQIKAAGNSAAREKGRLSGSDTVRV
jgi:hypothetical protein